MDDQTPQPITRLDRVRTLADSLDCLIQEDIALLSGVKFETTEAWRKHGKLPPYIRLGNRFLYPRAEVTKWLATLVHTKPTVLPVGDLL